MSNDSGFLKDWNLIQIEGEEPVEAVVEDIKVKGGKAPPAKAAAKGATTALEEITDNRPRIISFEKKFGGEQEGGKII
jgi:GTP cyclohydrolase III